MKKSHILFIMPKLDTGGAERVIVNIINHLNRDKFNITIALFNSRGSLIDELQSDIDIYDLNISSVLKGVPKLLLYIFRLKPDTIFTGIGNLNLYLSLFIPIMRVALPKSKWIARQASILTLNNQQEKSPKLYEWLYKRVYKNYDMVVCQSQYMQKDLIDNYSFPKDKSVIINNPIDIKRVESLSLEKIDYPFSKETINLISVGQLRYEKRQDLLLKTFAKLDNRYRLILIGEGAKRGELERLAMRLNISNRVAILGYKKNPYPYIKQSDMFILTSKYEGFPNVLLEANICGLSVISFNSIGGISEIIKNGVNGTLVPYGNVESLSKAIKEVEPNLFNSNYIKELTARKYSIELIIKEYENILKDKL